MSDKQVEKFYDDILCKDLKTLTEILASMSNSYRLMVGAAEEFNRITLVHRHEAEEAIDRAAKMGNIIDEAEKELKGLMKLYLRELVCKIEIQQLYNNKASFGNNQSIIINEIFEEIDEKE